jgi:hypothetical protein
LKAIEFMGHDKPAVQKAGRALIVSMVDEPTKSPGDEVQAMIEKVAAATRVT